MDFFAFWGDLPPFVMIYNHLINQALHGNVVRLAPDSRAG
jgi:hypothetical protein